jgi:predicted nucleic acid-binding protein
MKIVVDTNIIFSALLNSNSTIGELLFNSDQYFDFYSCSYMRLEINKHWHKLKKISKLSEEQLHISYTQVLSKLKFINEELIPSEIWLQAEKITKDIDIDDIDFVAMVKFLKATLWTGDKVLYTGLKKIGFKKICNTHDLNLIWNLKSGNKSQ